MLYRAVKLVYAGKAEVVTPTERPLRAENFAMRAPSVIRMLYYVKRPPQRVSLTKRNVLARDEYRCQYCDARDERLMTIDHVVPKSKGGPSTWENLVCACMRCNNRKNNRSPEDANMRLRRQPRAPYAIPWVRRGGDAVPEAWRTYLFMANVGTND